MKLRGRWWGRLKTASLLCSKTSTLSKQKTIRTEALEADALLRWRWKTFELKRERGADAFVA